MKLFQTTFAMLLATAFATLSCNNEAGTDNKTSEERKDSAGTAMSDSAAIREEAVSYAANGTTLNGFVAYDSTRQEKRPIVLVVPEWWGLTDYPRMRAKQLAQLGYLAMAVDIYGNGKIADNPDEALKSATPFYKDPQEAKARLEAALAKAKTYPQADTSQTAAIGYCFGGSMVLNAAKLGSDFDGVVSFHGGLEGVPANKDLLKAKILVCHGAADNFVPQAQVDAFRKSLDSIHADYTFKAYPNATHAFTNPDADNKAAKFNMPIKYNAAADSASWNDMKDFFGRIFH
ncbi:MAG TPA: dienelactone hydrolase family protein [Flavisolibacter sp.]|nr:dienelactone hydrolase family protein [Flavisolibacter sp.]